MADNKFVTLEALKSTAARLQQEWLKSISKAGSGISVTADGTVNVSTSGITPEEVVSAADTDKMLDEIFPAES